MVRSPFFSFLLSAFCFSLPSLSQDALRSSLAGEAAAASRARSIENMPYTVKSGDFRLLMGASLGFDYNDNIRNTGGEAEDDFILRPMLNLQAAYPLTVKNTLNFRVGIGYDWYLQNDDYSGFRLAPSSDLSFDFYVKDWWFNVHDRFSYSVDSAGEPGVSRTSRYGGFDNTAGVTGTWDLQDMVVTLGFDHNNFISASSEYDYQNRMSELPVGRFGFQFHPRLTAGVEATGSFTDYELPVHNDSMGYSAGVYADWRPGNYFSVQPRLGYSSYFFDQTSLLYPADDQSGWYLDLAARHQITDAISYSVSGGRQFRLGVEADLIDSWYARLSATWRFYRNLTFTPGLSYENGTQSGGRSVSETYDWWGATFGLGCPVTTRLNASLNYRLTIRSSDRTLTGDYTQNLVGLQLTYTFQ